jgi:AcrR family transcriptional regulator
VLKATRVELLEGGYLALSHRAVARRAGVDPTTVYRRWPTRSRLVADALLDYAAQAVPVPDTGSLEGDLTAFLEAVVAIVGDPHSLRVIQSLVAVSADAEPDLKQTMGEFWSARLAGAEAMVTRAVRRGELRPSTDAHAVVETLVAPVYFRGLLSGAPLDPEFVRRGVRNALAVARGS